MISVNRVVLAQYFIANIAIAKLEKSHISMENNKIEKTEENRCIASSSSPIQVLQVKMRSHPKQLSFYPYTNSTHQRTHKNSILKRRVSLDHLKSRYNRTIKNPSLPTICEAENLFDRIREIRRNSLNGELRKTVETVAVSHD